MAKIAWGLERPNYRIYRSDKLLVVHMLVKVPHAYDRTQKQDKKCRYVFLADPHVCFRKCLHQGFNPHSSHFGFRARQTYLPCNINQ